MQGNQKIVELLNDYLTMELTAVNIYFAHSRMAANWGYERLAERLREIAFAEMKDTEEIIDRILYFEGLPNVQRLGTVTLGENGKEALQIGVRIEREALEFLNRGIETCVEEGDQATREFLAHAVGDEEEHLEWLETQLELIDRIGEELYFSQQVHG